MARVVVAIEEVHVDHHLENLISADCPIATLSVVHLEKILNIVCSSDETLGSAIGRSLLKHCLQDVFGNDSRAGSPGNAHGEEEDVFESCLERLEDFASTMQQLPLAVQLVQVYITVGIFRGDALRARQSIKIGRGVFG